MERNGQTHITLIFIGVCLILGWANYDEPWTVKLMFFFPVAVVFILIHILAVLWDIRDELARRNHHSEVE